MMDPLSEILRSVRLAGGVFLEARFTAPWCVSACISSMIGKAFLSKPSQLVAYHYIVEGELQLSFEGQPPVAARAGEIIMFPNNEGHMLSSGPGVAPVSTEQLVGEAAEGGLMRIDHGGGGTPTRIICGFLALEDDYHPLVATLPRCLKVDVRQGASSQWIEAATRFAAAELAREQIPPKCEALSPQGFARATDSGAYPDRRSGSTSPEYAPGRTASSVVVAKLAELLFVEAVRQHVASHGEQEIGWLRGLKDPYVGRALALLHDDIGKTWSAEDLAREVALSRSAFVERFSASVGMPPARYAALWRLQTAKRHLRETQKSVAQIAYAVGYESEEAFSRAFKRAFGLPPAHWRDQPAVT